LFKADLQIANDLTGTPQQSKHSTLLLKRMPITRKQKTMSDITARRQAQLPKFDSKPENSKPRKKKKHIKRYLALLLLVVIVFYAVRAIGVRELAKQTATDVTTDFLSGKQALTDLNPHQAQASFEAANSKINNIEQEANRFGLLSIAKVWGFVADEFKKIPQTLSSIKNVSVASIGIAREIAYLQDNAFSLAVHNRGQEIINALTSIRNNITVLPDAITTLSSANSAAKESLGADPVSAQVKLYQTEQLLTSLIAWLNNPKEQHLAILLQNPSEIRPGGGFAGSYIDIGIQKANLNTIDVRDIYDPDGQLDAKIIPPEQLQLITKRWGARDANWFFDFPTSARKVTELLNQSKIYQERQTEFVGAIAINVNVIKDILSITGPITLPPEYNFVLTADNVLTEIQSEVEAGKDKTNGEPKRIIKIATPLLLDRIAQLNATEKSALVNALKERIASKDIMISVRDIAIEAYLRQLGVNGEVYQPTTEALSEYLATANANIAGGKSDAFIKQHTSLESQIDITGQITNQLVITRTHTGKKQKEAWYRATNKNYLQILLPKDTKVTKTTGRDKWPTIPKWDFEGFKKDADIQAIESATTFDKSLGLDIASAYGKTIAALWLNTPAGSTSTFTLTYQNPVLVNLDRPQPYEFVYEKQSGVDSSLAVTITAPPGFIFQETNATKYTYQNENPPARLVVPLTITPIQL
jgi:hypothetical protein